MKFRKEIMRLLDSYSESLSFLGALNKLKYAISKTVDYVDTVNMKLDSVIENGGTGIVVDDELSSTSANPVENRVVNRAFENLEDNFTEINDFVLEMETNIVAQSSDIDDLEKSKLGKHGHVANKNVSTDSDGNIVFTDMPTNTDSVDTTDFLTKSGLDNDSYYYKTLNGTLTQANRPRQVTGLTSVFSYAYPQPKEVGDALATKVSKTGNAPNKNVTTNGDGEIVFTDMPSGGGGGGGGLQMVERTGTMTSDSHIDFTDLLDSCLPVTISLVNNSGSSTSGNFTVSSNNNIRYSPTNGSTTITAGHPSFFVFLPTPNGFLYQCRYGVGGSGTITANGTFCFSNPIEYARLSFNANSYSFSYVLRGYINV